MTKKYLKSGIGLIGASVVMGSIPNISGTAGEATVKSNFSEGLSNVSKVYPVWGNVIGTKMVLKQTKGLQKSIKFKRVKKL